MEKKLVIIKIKLNKMLYLYIFADFCSKKMFDIDHQSWIYFIAGHPVHILQSSY